MTEVVASSSSSSADPSRSPTTQFRAAPSRAEKGDTKTGWQIGSRERAILPKTYSSLASDGSTPAGGSGIVSSAERTAFEETQIRKMASHDGLLSKRVNASAHNKSLNAPAPKLSKMGCGGVSEGSFVGKPVRTGYLLKRGATKNSKWHKRFVAIPRYTSVQRYTSVLSFNLRHDERAECHSNNFIYIYIYMGGAVPIELIIFYTLGHI